METMKTLGEILCCLYRSDAPVPEGIKRANSNPAKTDLRNCMTAQLLTNLRV